MSIQPWWLTPALYAAAALYALPHAAAQLVYPSEPVQMIVPYTAGMTAQ